MHLPDVSFHKLDASLLPPLETKLPRTQHRLVSLLREGTGNQDQNTLKSWSLDPMLKPQRFESSADGRELGRIIFQRTRFNDQSERFEPRARVSPSEDGELATLDTTLAFRSIGYRSIALRGLKELGIIFDESLGIIPNDPDGRVVANIDLNQVSDNMKARANILPGLYCAGWVKRGPAGVIANTMEDAFATAHAIATDWENKRPFLKGGDGWQALSSEAQGLRSVGWSDWLKIDAAEKSRGALEGKERIKFTSIPDMLTPLD